MKTQLNIEKAKKLLNWKLLSRLEMGLRFMIKKKNNIMKKKII